MKLIIPMAGKGTRLKPHTHTTPKPLMHVAGKPVLSHLLDSISSLNIDTAIFIVDQENPELAEYLKSNYPFKSVFIQQKERKGVAHAIYGARNHAKDDSAFILFSDSLIEADLKGVEKTKEDGIIWTKEVKDPRNFGVVFLHEGKITRLIEKPDTPVSDKAIVGMYYIKESNKLFNAIECLIKDGIMTKGEYQITDALQLMINNNAKFISSPVKEWKDCGSVPNLLETNKYLLEKNKKLFNESKNSVIIKPVFIAKGAKVENSIIGPNVSVGKEAVIENSIISDSIINEKAYVKGATLKDCIIGKEARVHGTTKKLNIGDSSEIHYS